jgi:RimJ/RimL family protein N-acetyltransferase
MKYEAINNECHQFEDYKIISIRDEDKYKIMNWRNDQISILRQNHLLTKKEQDLYFEKIHEQKKESNPSQILFSYLKDDELIGYGGIVHINWIDQRGEVSFLLETRRNKNISQFKTEYAFFLQLIKKVAFQDLGFNKLTTEAFDLRPYLIETLECNGFIQEGRLKSHIFMNGVYVDSLLHACFNKA